MTETSDTPEITVYRRLPATRQSQMVAYTTERGEVTVNELAEYFTVSLDTVRRDLDRLDTDGLLLRTHGGAISPSGFPRPDSGVDLRVRVQAEAKEAIGRLAAGLVADNSSIMINSGTTALALARNLSDHQDLTIATNNLRLPAEINPKALRDLYVFGGTARIVSQATIGPIVFRLSQGSDDIDIRSDLALIGVGAVSLRQGFSTSNLNEAAMMAEMIQSADKVAILADSSKFGRQLFARIAGFEGIDYLVTDSAPEPEIAQALVAAGVQVLVAG